MEQYSANVQEPYFSYIKSGVKFVEGRLFKGKWRIVKPFDTILITEPKTGETIKKTIRYRVVSSNFKELYFLYKKSLLPDAENEKDAERIYSEFYSEEDVAKYGVIGMILI